MSLHPRNRIYHYPNQVEIFEIHNLVLDFNVNPMK